MSADAQCNDKGKHSGKGKTLSPLETYLLAVTHGKPGLTPALVRTALAALAPVYCAGLKTYLLPYRLGIRKRFRLPCPVLCVGNLTTGGTGKTPMTQTLCRLLLAHGKRPAILSRGYGGENEYGCAVVSDGERVMLSARQAGDEAHLLATSLPGVPVVVGKDRRVTGSLAWERFHPDLIVLDDGLQFWQLHRDLDIVLLNAVEPFDNGWTFPRGLLREPPSHLRRAGIVVLTNTAAAGEAKVAALQARVRRLTPESPCFCADLAAIRLRSVTDRVEYSVDWLSGRAVAALSALGNPASFETMLARLDAVVRPVFRFRDHQAITLADLERVFQEACAAGAEAIVTTDKDAVKLPRLKTPIPLLALEVAMGLTQEAEFVDAILTVLTG